MTFGIGVGAFVDGFSQGLGARSQLDEQRTRRKQRRTLNEINTETRTAFDQAVAQGQARPDQYEQFWMRYALPKMRMKMLQAGDVEGAQAFAEWGQSEAARQGAQLFMSGLVKAQTGDYDGAIGDAVQAGKVKGYINSDYSLDYQNEVHDKNGNVIAYQFKLTGPDGKEEMQDVPPDKVMELMSIYANPQAAWESQKEAKAARDKRAQEDKDDLTKRGRDLADHRSKKQIDEEFEEPEFAKRYRAAEKTLSDSDFRWSSYSPEERDQRVRESLQRAEDYERDSTAAAPSATGAVAAEGAQRKIAAPKPTKSLIVDTKTGKPVEPASRPGLQQPGAAAPGLGDAPQSNRPAPQAGQDLTPVSQMSAEQKKQELTAARDRMLRGGNIKGEYDRLRDMGFTDQEIEAYAR